jgi:hypothetical protein
VVTRHSRCRIFLAAILSCLIIIAARPGNAGTLHYYTEFNAEQVPWQAPEEKNFEEVFKNYEFFAIVYSNAGRDLEVSRFVNGSVADISHWQLQPDGSLLALDRGQDSPGRRASVPAALRKLPWCGSSGPCGSCIAAGKSWPPAAGRGGAGHQGRPSSHPDASFRQTA